MAEQNQSHQASYVKNKKDLIDYATKLRVSGFDESNVELYDPTSQIFMDERNRAIEMAQQSIIKPENPLDKDMPDTYYAIRGKIQSQSRAIVMRTIEFIRGYFPVAVIVGLIAADGIRFYDAILQVSHGNVITSVVLAIAGMLSYVMLLVSKAIAFYAYKEDSGTYKWSFGLVRRRLRYIFSGPDFEPENVSRFEVEYRKTTSQVFWFKVVMAGLIIVGPILNGTLDLQNVTLNAILSIIGNIALTITMLTMLDSVTKSTYTLYADRDGDVVKGDSYFLEQRELYRKQLEAAGRVAEMEFMLTRKQQAASLLKAYSKQTTNGTNVVNGMNAASLAHNSTIRTQPPIQLEDTDSMKPILSDLMNSTSSETPSPIP